MPHHIEPIKPSIRFPLSTTILTPRDTRIPAKAGPLNLTTVHRGPPCSAIHFAYALPSHARRKIEMNRLSSWRAVGLAGAMVLFLASGLRAQPTSHEPYDRLLVLAVQSCNFPGAGWRPPTNCTWSFAGLVQRDGSAWAYCSSVDGLSPVVHRELIRGTIRVRTEDSLQNLRACHVESVIERTTRHELSPLASGHFAGAYVGASVDDHLTHLGAPLPSTIYFDARGSGMLMFVTAWLEDIPAEFVTPGRVSFTRRDLEVALRRELAAASPRNRIGRQDYFAPEIRDRPTRVAMALTPTLSVQLAEGGESISGIPMCRGSSLAFRVAEFGSIPGSIASASWRSIIRQAVLEEHARPWTREDPECSHTH